MAVKGFKTIDSAALDVRRIGIGMLGYGFMGKVHSNAFLKIPYSFKATGRPIPNWLRSAAGMKPGSPTWPRGCVTAATTPTGNR